MIRELSVALIFAAASVGPCAAISVAKDVVWFTGASLSDLVEWSADDSLSVCALDAFHFGVSFPSLQSPEQDSFKWQLIAKTVEGWEKDAVVASGQLKVRVVDREKSDKDDERVAIEVERGLKYESGLMCEFDPDFCVPKLVGIRLPDVDGKNEEGESLQKDHSIVLEFEQSTNRPDARSKVEIEQFVAFTEYIGDEIEGTWSDDGRVLVIRILDVDTDKVKPVGELMQGLLLTSIFVGARNERSGQDGDEVVLYNGAQSFRIEPPGIYAIRVFTLHEVAVWSPEVSIVPCDASYIVMNPTRATPLSTTGLSEEIPSDMYSSFAIDGVLTHGGDEGFVLPHDAIQAKIPGSWSLSFWVFLTEDSTGSFRTLFFNGDGNNQQRTPSAWWKPDERRLVLRVSTNTSSDVGLDSGDEVPLNEWTHMGFTFVNCSQSNIANPAIIHESCPQNDNAAKSWMYSYSFYINGLLDTEVRIHEPVVANSGPLHIGKGPWTKGMKGFTSNLRVFSVPISSEQQRKIYFSERLNHKNYGKSGEDSYFDAEMKEPANQISYLSQCFTFGENNTHDVGNESLDENDDKDLEDSVGFGQIQTKAYAKYVRGLESCEPDTWDLLLESADLGHSTACFAVGEAYLYGSNGGHHHCPVPFPINQNWTLARNYLAKAFKGKVYSAGKSFALLLALHDSSGFVEGRQLSMFTTGFIHFAAASGEKDAFAMLGRRYHALGHSAVEIATYHYYQAAVQSSKDFHQLGKQPLHEMTRLYDSFERDVTAGERGDDDELIQFQKLRADKGDVDAMAAMGDLYYWGAHGISRDHAQAYNYFHRAAQAGSVNSQAAVAGMLLKGEGTAQDNVTAIKWYERASEKNNTRALNGLGFIHFHGSGGVPENKSLALEFFELAAGNEEDGDSIFNAGYCHAIGLGTNVNISRAMEYYDVAARKFGHFDAIFEMGKILMNGVPGVVSRNSGRALDYLKAASDGGQWGSTVRKGFDLYTDGEFDRAAVLYHEALELGYPVAISNLAFLYDQRLLQPGDIMSERRALKYLLMTNKENGDRETLVRIGDYHYYGLAGIRKDPKTALRWYSRGSAEGVALGAYNVGFMYEFGDGVQPNLKRAQRYYNRVLELSSGAAESQLTIRFAMARLSFRRWLQNTPFEVFLNSSTNTSMSNSPMMFDTTTRLFDGKLYALISTTAIIFVSIVVWYFHT
ncbi:Suppressor of lin-12 [Phytophthora megakarya]|uniref:Suppressor of lin-12 n=1 Tax=Phytophthora megakarya TaxID=4795 RepID=A0A225WH48_9STRA|nr:Suppressor of lin-12 [Phytophthora megakarya]